jgi:hypothetical protein
MQTPTAVAVDGVIPLGSLIRRYGCDVAINGNAVNILSLIHISEPTRH